MSWEAEYRGQFTDINGIYWDIVISSDDYAGEEKAMAMAGDPLTIDWLSPSEKVYESPVKGSFVTFNVLSRTDFQYAPLYAVSDFQYKVDIYYQIGEASLVLYWSGWIISGNYSEPYDDATYMVSISANDGLGILKKIKYKDGTAFYDGMILESQIILDILSEISITSFREFINIYEVDMADDVGDSPMDQIKLNADVFKDMTCYEVLSHILIKYNAVIKQIGGNYIIYRPTELIETTVYGRSFTAATTKSAITMTPSQMISRVGAVTNIRSVNGGIMMVEPPAKKITIYQDYGSKESWIDNWELGAETYVNADFDYWTQYNGTYARPLSDYVSREKSGVAIIGNNFPGTAYKLSQTFSTDAVLSTTDEFMLEFEWGMWNNTAGTYGWTQLLLQISIDTSPRQYLQFKTNNSGYDDNVAELEWAVANNSRLLAFWRQPASGWSGWETFQRKFTGIPAAGSITVELFGTQWGTQVYSCYKDVKFYMTSDETIKMPSAWYARGRLSTMSPTYNRMRFSVPMQLRTEKTYTFSNPITHGEELEYDVILGDVKNTNADNVLSQFAGAVGVFITPDLTPSTLWAKIGDAIYTDIVTLKGNELKEQYSRPRQIITMPIIDKGNAPALSVIGRLQDSLNEYNDETRYFVINSARFNVRDREWSVDLVEVIDPAEVVVPDPEEIAGNPSSFTATAAGWDSITLAWTDGCTNEEGYELQRSLDESDWVTVKLTAAGATSYIDSGLDANTLYYYRLRGYLGDDVTDWVTDDATTDERLEIYADPIALSVDWESLEYSDYCFINVYPVTMETTLTKTDTGDGTAWANLTVAGGTGSYSFRLRAASDNGATPRSMSIVISDDASEADDVTVTLTQQPEPV